MIAGIDLEDSYFQGVEFYQQVSRLTKDTLLSEAQIRECKKKLVKAGVISITKKGIPSKDHFTINHNVIHNWFTNDTSTGDGSVPVQVMEVYQQDKESSNTKNLNTKIKLDKISNEEKVLNVLIDKYPGSIGSSKPLLKALKELTSIELMQTIQNLDRYSILNKGFIHNLRNYIEGRHFLTKELDKKQDNNKPDNDKPDTKYIDKF
jgi:hypothetical protein